MAKIYQNRKTNPIKQKTLDFSRVFLWYLAESNRGHKDFQSFALPTELRYLPNWECKNIFFFI
jgi:hypothetical protein